MEKKEQKYEPLKDGNIKAMANDTNLTTAEIMRFYKDAQSLTERVDIIKLMKTRIQVCIDRKQVF